MNKVQTATLTLVFGLAIPFAAQAGNKAGKEGKEGNLPTHRILKRFDTNGNGIIDPGAESDALRVAFAKNAKLKYLDTNNDGKLDDAEITAIKGDGKGGKHGKKKEVSA
jgi:hypothetical protein